MTIFKLSHLESLKIVLEIGRVNIFPLGWVYGFFILLRSGFWFFDFFLGQQILTSGQFFEKAYVFDFEMNRDISAFLKINLVGSSKNFLGLALVFQHPWVRPNFRSGP